MAPDSSDPGPRICYLYKPGDKEYLEEMKALMRGEDPRNDPPRQGDDGDVDEQRG